MTVRLRLGSASDREETTEIAVSRFEVGEAKAEIAKRTVDEINMEGDYHFL